MSTSISLFFSFPLAITSAQQPTLLGESTALQRQRRWCLRVSWQNWGQNFDQLVKQLRGPSMMQRHGPSVCLYNTSQSDRSGRRHPSPSPRRFPGLFPTMKLESHWQHIPASAEPTWRFTCSAPLLSSRIPERNGE
jgi:hypothetical protein